MREDARRAHAMSQPRDAATDGRFVRVLVRRRLLGYVELTGKLLHYLHFAVFYQNADCLMELDQKREAKECHDEALAQINLVTANAQMNYDDKLNRMCR